MAHSKVKFPSQGRVVITTKRNNLFVTLTDVNGNVLISMSSGWLQSGKKKVAPLTAKQVAKAVTTKALDAGMSGGNIFLHGLSSSRDHVVQTINNLGFRIGTIVDLTSFPHGGCRLKKEKRN